MATERKLTRQEIKDILYRRRYAVPNAVTVGNMFCGFLAIMYASSDRLEKAVVAILIAILLDGLDGRVARRLNATSKFGVEFDSFSDVVSFGLAPAVMMYHWAFQKSADEVGVAVTFLYALCAASRLARFNISTENLKSFSGLPTPGAAAFMVAVINIAPYAHEGYSIVPVALAVTLSMAYLMVSTIEFASIKSFKVTGVKMRVRLLIGVVMVLVWKSPSLGLLALSGVYAASGPFLRIRRYVPRWLGGAAGRPADKGSASSEKKIVSM
jgi:CDP-diacylglycerol--serine O-phosphatidyltransferase